MNSIKTNGETDSKLKMRGAAVGIHLKILNNFVPQWLKFTDL